MATPDEPRDEPEDPRSPGLAALGFGDRVAALATAATDTAATTGDALADGNAGGGPGGIVPARVVRSDRGWVWAATDDAIHMIEVGTLPSAEELAPVTGDWVLVDPAVPALRAVLPRWSAITRMDALGRAEQVLAADIDVVLIVHGFDRRLRPGRIERSLLLAWESGARPAIALTKVDLAATPEALEEPATLDDVLAVLDELAAGVDVVACSTHTGEGIDAVRALVADGSTMVLLGESGAGKSSVVNALIGTDVQATGEVRSGDFKGRHTTTSRELLVLPGGGVVIDTPGLRSLGLPSGDESLAAVFPDIEALAADCRFRDCAHRREPGCAVRSAAEGGELDPARLERYLTLQDELAAQEQSRVEAERERKRTGRIQSRAIRQFQRDRGPRSR